MRTVLPILLLVATAAAGCIDPAATAGPATGEPAALLVDASATEGGVHRWAGSLQGPGPTVEGQSASLACFGAGAGCREAPPACDESSCERVEFTVDVPEDHWVTHEGAAVLSVRWPSQPGPMLDAWIEDASGKVVAYSPDGYAWTVGQTAVLPNPAPGRYVAVVGARQGDSAYEAAVRLESRPLGEPRPLLPDLVALAPSDLTMETPDYGGISYFAVPIPGVREAATAAGTSGCRVDEVVETSGRRCLRFSTVVGNVGDGPLEVRLGLGASSFVQRVLGSDGAWTEHAAGPAEWHATHAHWHHAAANHYAVYAYDSATGERGEQVGEGKKGGICFADTGIVDVGLPHMGTPMFPGRGCLEPASAQSWIMGISPGWYDVYGYVLSDQYVEMEGVPDGAYQLCVAINTDALLLESDAANNEACTAFRLTGNAVERLDPVPYYESRR